MPDADVAQQYVPYVHMADASVQDPACSDAQFPGLENDRQYLWTMIDTADGRRFFLLRYFMADSMYVFSLAECPDDLWSFPTNVRAPGERELYLGPVEWAPEGRTLTMVPKDEAKAAAHPVSLTLGPDGFRLRDEDVIDVTFTPLPNNVTTIYLPGPWGDEAYTSSGCTVSGTIDGSPIVGGYGGLDRMYSRPGAEGPSTIAELQHYWFVWGSLMDDGTWETGNAMLGPNGFALATFCRPGEPPLIGINGGVTNDVTWETRGELSQPTHSTLSFGGRTFEFVATYNFASEPASKVIAGLQGTAREVGGPTPARSWWVCEAFKGRIAAES
jgi:hypothetical protein